eukprot:6336030-Amphidinium_carterae.2
MVAGGADARIRVQKRPLWGVQSWWRRISGFLEKELKSSCFQQLVAHAGGASNLAARLPWRFHGEEGCVLHMPGSLACTGLEVVCGDGMLVDLSNQASGCIPIVAGCGVLAVNGRQMRCVLNTSQSKF